MAVHLHKKTQLSTRFRSPRELISPQNYQFLNFCTASTTRSAARVTLIVPRLLVMSIAGYCSFSSLLLSNECTSFYLYLLASLLALIIIILFFPIHILLFRFPKTF